MGKLKEKLQTLEVALMGNRVTLLGASMIGLGFYDLKNCLLALSGVTGYALLGWTQLGLGTLEKYLPTRGHIKRHGTIDERFFKSCAGDYSKKPFTGYCQLQGMYLAARDYGCLEEFKRLKRERSNNKIPNF